MFWNGSTAMDGLSDRVGCCAGLSAVVGSAGAAGFGSSGKPDLKRVDPHRLGDVLERLLAEIRDREVEPGA